MLASKTLFAIVVALTATTNAVVVDLYSDTNCKTAAGHRNVYDESCAPLGGFKSFKITTAGGTGQYLRAYSRNACAGPNPACVDATLVDGTCYQATDSDGGSNAMGSSVFPACTGD